MRLRLVLTAFAVCALGVLGMSSASADRLPDAAHGGHPLDAVLLPGSETPPHATAATGSAHITVNPGHAEVCWDITFANLSAPATAAHIHIAPPGVPGPIVIPTPVPSVISGTGSGCTVVAETLAHALNEHPADYYVNVHDAVFPGGEIRGQLS
jgi:hypothetical protein